MRSRELRNDGRNLSDEMELNGLFRWLASSEDTGFETTTARQQRNQKVNATPSKDESILILKKSLKSVKLKHMSLEFRVRS